MTIKLPPLVDPAAEIGPDSVDRHARQLKLPGVGLAGQRRLRNARVLIIGAGGLGSPVIFYLAAAGVGALGIVDDDVVEVSNLQRQILHRSADIAGLKASSAARAVKELDPGIQVQVITERFTESSASRIVQGWDLVLDGSDNFDTRYVIDDACAAAGIPHIWGAVFQFEGQFSVFWRNPPAGPGFGYRDLYPAPPPSELVPHSFETGVLGAHCGVVGSCMAMEAIKLVTGAGPVALGSLHLVDTLTWSISVIPICPSQTHSATGDTSQIKKTVPDRRNPSSTAANQPL